MSSRNNNIITLREISLNEITKPPSTHSPSKTIKYPTKNLYTNFPLPLLKHKNVSAFPKQFIIQNQSLIKPTHSKILSRNVHINNISMIASKNRPTFYNSNSKFNKQTCVYPSIFKHIQSYRKQILMHSTSCDSFQSPIFNLQVSKYSYKNQLGNGVKIRDYNAIKHCTFDKDRNNNIE